MVRVSAHKTKGCVLGLGQMHVFGLQVPDVDLSHQSFSLLSPPFTLSRKINGKDTFQ